MAIPRKPTVAQVTACALAAVLAIVAGVYFGGHGQLPPAMAGAALFVLLGGLTFELARRRSR
jgi:Na+-transporting NADH:ubiquinone oxidoreductase subunit NqrB